MNSSVPWAAESFADAAQSIASTSSPGWYCRELATSDPLPRFALWALPKASTIRRRRGTSGKLSSVGALMALTVRQWYDLAVAAERTLRPRCRRETARPEVLQRRNSTDLPDLDQERRRKQDPVADHRKEQELDVLGEHVVASGKQRPAAGSALQCEAAANGRPDRDDVELAGHPDEVDDPPLQELVHVHRRRRVLQGGDVLDLHDGLEVAERMTVELVPHDVQLVVAPGIAERRP